MRQDITSYISLFSLDELDIRLHPFFCKGSSEFIVDVCVGMQSGELSVSASATDYGRVYGASPTVTRKELTVINWKMKPNFPNSHTYSFISFSPKPAASQLKLGLRLYANH